MSVSIFVCLFCVLNLLSWASCANETNNTSTGDDVKLPNHNTELEWEKRALINLTIVASLILAIVAGVFFVRYMRAEKKNKKRRYAPLKKAADDDDDIELSIYEKQ